MDEHGLREEIGYVNTILEGGTSADRQLAVYHRGHDMRAVVDHVIAETQEGLDG